jgi:hypothetical protein
MRRAMRFENVQCASGHPHAHAQPGARIVTLTTMPGYEPDASLWPSGPIGPVQLLEVR